MFEKYFRSFVQSSEFEDITLENPLDMHLHLREAEMCQCVLPFSAVNFISSLVMPNLTVPITNTELALIYKGYILGIARKKGIYDYCPLMSLYLTTSLDKAELLRAKNAGIKILKLYPKGVTTGSEGGVAAILDEKILEILQIAQDLGFILSVHGESTGYCLEREFEFLVVFETLARDFPKLKIIIEHMSDSRSLRTLEKFDNLYATLSLHHMLLSLDDMLGGNLKADLFCKPILKGHKDRDALLQTALSGHKKVSFGSDSAPHLQEKKYSPSSPGGIFSAPILLPMLACVFAYHNKLENLQAFISDNPIANYGLESFIQDILQQSHSQAKLRHLCFKPYKIPESVPCGKGTISVLFGNKTCPYSLCE